jgi:hypothetical protein
MIPIRAVSSAGSVGRVRGDGNPRGRCARSIGSSWRPARGHGAGHASDRASARTCSTGFFRALQPGSGMPAPQRFPREPSSNEEWSSSECRAMLRPPSRLRR